MVSYWLPSSLHYTPMQVVRNHNFCSLEASVPFGSRRGVVGIEPTGDSISFPRNFSQTVLSACFFRQFLADRYGLYPAGVQLVCSGA